MGLRERGRTAGGAAVTGDRHPDNVRFGPFLLQGRERRLVRDGTPIALEPRSFDVLSLLVAHAGSLVTKDDLLTRVWAGRVVEEGNLHVHIAALRKLLGPAAIATVARHGYRFTLPVEAFAVAVEARPELCTTCRSRCRPSSGARTTCCRSRSASRVRGWSPWAASAAAARRGSRSRSRHGSGPRSRTAFASSTWRTSRTATASRGRSRRRSTCASSATFRCSRPSFVTAAAAHLLLVLDNCEHVVDACAAMLASLLAATTSLRVLATSRERLGVPGEVVVSLRALTAPPAGAEADLQALPASESVRLFIDRARQVVPEFGLDAANAAAIAEICRRLDGIPLAIELAAALVELLSVEQIRGRLDDRFRLLAGSVRADPRHRTLLATLASSYACLAPAEQRCLARVAVFTGGFTLEAAAAVAGDGDEIAMLRLIGRLVDKSLVQVDRSGDADPRYMMLETVREYARAELATTGDAAVVQARHRDYFLAFARIAQAQMLGAGTRTWTPRIHAELPNLLAACAACDALPDGVATRARPRGELAHLLACGGTLRRWAARLRVGARRTGGDPRALARGKALYALGQHLYVFGRLQ